MANDLDTLNHFIEQQAAQGKLSANTAQSYLSSISRVFEAATSAEKADVLGLDLDALFARFRDKNSGLGANTVASYEGRVRAAINSFDQQDRTGTAFDAPPHSVMGTLAIPLRSGVVRIEGLPSDLTEAEANRIAKMVVAMAN